MEEGPAQVGIAGGTQSGNAEGAESGITGVGDAQSGDEHSNASPEQTSPEKTSPEKTSPEKTSPEKTSPEKTSPEKTSPEKTSPEKTGPDHPALTFKDYATSLLPWAAYIIGTHFISWKYGFIIGSGVAAIIVIKEMTKRESRFMDLGTLIFCLAMSCFALYNAKSLLKTYNLPLSLAYVGVLATISILIRSPFTYRCHRDHLPDEVVSSPEHNDILMKHHTSATMVWAVSEFIAGVISALLIWKKYGDWAVVCQAVGTLIPMGYTQMVHHRIHLHPTITSHPAMAGVEES